MGRALTLNITPLDDALLPRFDPKLESLKEQKWAANPDLGELIESFDHHHLRLPRNNFQRFSESTNSGTDTALCEKPQRMPSLDSQCYKSSSSIQNLSHTSQTSIISEYRSSKGLLPPTSFFLDEGEEEVLDIANDGNEKTQKPCFNVCK